MTTSRVDPVSERWLRMSPDERMAELERGRVVDRSELAPEVRARSEAMLKQARRNSGVETEPIKPVDSAR